MDNNQTLLRNEIHNTIYIYNSMGMDIKDCIEVLDNLKAILLQIE